MLKKTMTYTDYDGNQRTEDFYFNLNEAEVIEMELSTGGGMQRLFDKLTKEQNGKELVSIFKEIIMKSYGEKSLDGRRFVKSPELCAAFEQTEAYSNLFVELATDAKAAADFVNGIMPKSKDAPAAVPESV